VEESCKRSLDHFPNPTLCFPSPALDFDFRLCVKLRSEVSHVQSKTVGNTVTPKEIIAISSGQWSGSFGNGRVLVRPVYFLPKEKCIVVCYSDN
jgi:hypothetical protein